MNRIYRWMVVPRLFIFVLLISILLSLGTAHLSAAGTATPTGTPTRVPTPMPGEYEVGDVLTWGNGDAETGRAIEIEGTDLMIVGRDNGDALLVRYPLSLAGPSWNALWGGTNDVVGEWGYGLCLSSGEILMAGSSYNFSSDLLGTKEAKGALSKFVPPATAPSWYQCPNIQNLQGTEFFCDAVQSGAEIYACGAAKYAGCNQQAVLVKCNSQGNVVWKAFPTGTGCYKGSAQRIVCLNGYVYVTGEDGEGTSKAYLAKYSASGGLVWKKVYQPVNGTAGGYGLATDGVALYETGWLEVSANRDIFISKYDESGGKLWEASWGGAGLDRGWGIDTSADRILVVGESSTFGTGDKDVLLLELGIGGGSILGASLWGGSGEDVGYDVSVSGSEAYVVGETSSVGAGGTDVLLLRYHSTGPTATSTLNATSTPTATPTLTPTGCVAGRTLGSYAAPVQPYGLAHDGTNLWVAGRVVEGQYAIYKMDASGAVLSSFESPATAPHGGLAWDGHYLYLGTEQTECGGILEPTVWKLLPTGGLIDCFPGPEGHFVKGLVWDGVCLRASVTTGPGSPGRIYCMSSSGEVLGYFELAFDEPSGLAFDRGYLYCVDENDGVPLIHVMTPAGAEVYAFDASVFPGGGGFGLAWDPTRSSLWHGNVLAERLYELQVCSTGPTSTPTNGTPTRTPTRTPSMTPTRTPTNTPTMTPTETPTRTPSSTPTSTPTQVPTNTMTPTMTPTDTPSMTPTMTETPIVPTRTPTPIPTPGYLVGWGRNDYGQTSCPSGNDYVAIAAGGDHCLALRTDGSLVGWGRNDYGETSCPSGNDYVAIAAGGGFSLALRTDGSLISWGDNNDGQTSCPSGNNYVAIAAGASHSLALRSDASLVGWGNNNNGQTSCPSGNDYVAIAAGAWHSLALRGDGSLTGWGQSGQGQTSCPSGNDYVAIAAGNFHSLALKTDGSLVGWGGNYYGETSCPSGNDYVAIAAGVYHSLALRIDGSLIGWGHNSYGETDCPSGNDYVAIVGGARGWFSLAIMTSQLPTQTPTATSTATLTSTPTPTWPAGTTATPTAAPTATATQALPDLYDAGESYRSFSPTTICTGPFQIHCAIRNGGTASSGAFWVYFYASTDSLIAPSDYPIYAAYMSGIAPGGLDYCDVYMPWPSGLSTGTHYVGWIIDDLEDITESNESNNIAYKQGYLLNVSCATPTASRTPTGTPTRTMTPGTWTPTTTQTMLPTNTMSPTRTSTRTATPQGTATATSSPTRTFTWTSTRTPSRTPTATGTATATPGNFPPEDRPEFKHPKDGDGIYGAKVNVHLDVPEECKNSISVRFEYRPVGTGLWSTIDDSGDGHTDGEGVDSRYPFFAHWDTSPLAEGDYEVRATGIHWTHGPDPYPSSIVVHRAESPEQADQYGELDADGQHFVDREVSKAASEEIRIGHTEENTVTTLILPSESLQGDTRFVAKIEDLGLNTYRLGRMDYEGAEIRDFNLANNQTTLLGGWPAYVGIQYQDADSDGYVDGTAIREEDLRYYWWNETIQQWMENESGAYIDTDSNLICVFTPHFCSGSLLKEKAFLADTGWIRAQTRQATQAPPQNPPKTLAGMELYGDSIKGGIAGLAATSAGLTTTCFGHFDSGSRWYTGIALANPSETFTCEATLKAYGNDGKWLATKKNVLIPPEGKTQGLVSTLFEGLTGTGWIEVTSNRPLLGVEVYGDKKDGGVAALPAGAPSQELYLSHYVSDKNWWTGISVTNPNITEASVAMMAYSTSGNALSVKNLTIPKRGKFSGLVSEALGVTGTGSVRIVSDQPVFGLLVFGRQPGIGVKPDIASLVAQTPLTEAKFPSYLNGNGWQTSIAALNPGDVEIAIKVTILGMEGSVVGEKDVSLKGRQKYSSMLHTMFNLAGHGKGSILMESTDQFCAFELFMLDDGQNYGVAGVEPSIPDREVSLPHYASNAQWWTYFALWNPDVTKTQGVMEAFGEEGQYQDGIFVDAEGRGNMGDFLGNAFRTIGKSKRTSLYPGFRSELKRIDIDEFMQSEVFSPYRQN